MTQDEILEMVREAGGSDVGGHGWTTWVGTQSTEFLERFAKLVAAKERAPQRTEQEPVAWLEPEWGDRICPEVGYEVTMTDDHPRDLCWIPLYPHPPQRTWVGLTDEEQSFIYDQVKQIVNSKPFWVRFADAIEAKLKEKNA
jgi:hypothetical protein